MPTEIEAKFKLASTAILRDRLVRLGGDFVSTVLENNRILDTIEGRLRRTGGLLRLRTVRREDATGGPRVTLTYKGPQEGELANSGIKARQEIEAGVSEEAAMLSILSRLGLRPLLCYEKWRETWRLADCLVMLDEMPVLGCFAEIEGPSVAAVKNLQSLLEFPSDAAVSETYVALTERHGRLAPDGTRSLRFDH